MKRFEALFGGIAALALFAMMGLTFADVIGRKFFDQSLTGAVELTELFMLVMIYCGLPLASLAGEHIVFDLLVRFLPATALRWQRAISHGLTAAIVLAGAVVVYHRAVRTMEYGDTTATLVIRLGPFHYMVAAMLVVTALVHVYLAWCALRGQAKAAQ